jgi:membrane complex biogenesis BtpA family protein
MFNRKCSLIGVVHLQPLPGSAGYGGSMDEILRWALEDALNYKENGVDALIIENMHDVPFLNGHVEPETTAAMTIVAQSLKYETMLPLGVQILAGANLEALGVAIAASLDFIRVEGFVYAHVGDEGLHQSCAPQLIRRRAALKAENIKIFADIKKKHSAHAITSDVSLLETARAAEFFHADGVVVSGIATGHAPDAENVKTVRAGTDTHVLIGSGITEDNIDQFVPWADALIVGSSLKKDGKWNNHVDGDRVARLVERLEKTTKVAR